MCAQNRPCGLHATLLDWIQFEGVAVFHLWFSFHQPNLARLNIFQSSDSARVEFRVRLGRCNSTNLCHCYLGFIGSRKNLDGSNQPNDRSHCNLDFIDLGTVQLSLEKQRLQINACLWNSHLKHCISKCKVEAQKWMFEKANKSFNGDLVRKILSKCSYVDGESINKKHKCFEG